MGGQPGPATMIRVFYRWRVDGGAETGFLHWWHDGTLRIRNEQTGALGSCLLRSDIDPLSFTGMARWETREHLEAFWNSVEGQANPGWDLLGMELFEEVDDLIIGPN
jgi:heme-degrading monooxygenase HmoA